MKRMIALFSTLAICLSLLSVMVVLPAVATTATTPSIRTVAAYETSNGMIAAGQTVDCEVLIGAVSDLDVINMTVLYDSSHLRFDSAQVACDDGSWYYLTDEEYSERVDAPLAAQSVFAFAPQGSPRFSTSKEATLMTLHFIALTDMSVSAADDMAFAIYEAIITLKGGSGLTLVERPIYIPDELGTVCETPMDEALEVFRLINKERETAGVKPLVYAYDAQLMANIRVTEIGVLYSHTRPDGRDSFTVAEDVRYKSGRLMGENITVGQTTPAKAMAAWMNSTGHRENILREEISAVVVGYDPDANTWVQLFLEIYPSAEMTTTTAASTTTTTRIAVVGKGDGDVDGNGTVNIRDAVQCYYHVNGKVILDSESQSRADVSDLFGALTIRDAVTIYYFVNGKTDTL